MICNYSWRFSSKIIISKACKKKNCVRVYSLLNVCTIIICRNNALNVVQRTSGGRYHPHDNAAVCPWLSMIYTGGVTAIHVDCLVLICHPNNVSLQRDGDGYDSFNETCAPNLRRKVVISSGQSGSQYS